jgi:hypothetical protein
MGTAVVMRKAPAKIAALTLVFIFSSFWNEFTQVISNGCANGEENRNCLNLCQYSLSFSSQDEQTPD